MTKGAAITLGMLALATIGAVFTLRHPPGVALAHGNSVVIDSAWIKPDSPSSALGSHAPRAQRSDPSLSATRPADNDANTTADAPSSSGAPDSPDTPAPGSGITADGKVILNTATAEELTHLPGVGPKRAQAIVALRARLKRFKSPSDLLRVKGIGPKGLKKMLPHLVLDPPPPTAPS